MNTFIIPLLMASPQAGGGAEPGGNLLTGFLPIIAMILIFYFLLLRPQSKKRKETEKMLSALKKGDKVVTIGGLHGTIQKVNESTVILKADDNVKLEFLRSAISNVVLPSVSKDDKEDKREEITGEDGE